MTVIRMSKCTSKGLSLLLLMLLLPLASPLCQPPQPLPLMQAGSITFSNFSPPNITTGDSANFYTAAYTPLGSGSTVPEIVIAPTAYACSSFNGMNYFVLASLNSTSITFQFIFNNMVWSSMTVSYLLYTRQDIFQYRFQIQNIVPGQPQNASFLLPAELALFTLRYSPSIIGVQISPALQYDFGVTHGYMQNQTFSIQAYTNSPIAVLSVQIIFFDMASRLYAQASSTNFFQPLPNLQYLRLNTQFTPLVFTQMGMQSMKFTPTNKTFNLAFTLNVESGLIKIENNNTFDTFELGYFAVAQYAYYACSPCGNYITAAACVDQCPAGTYPYKYQTGGKTCRKCEPTLNQTLRADQSGCDCLPGFTFYHTQCINSTFVPNLILGELYEKDRVLGPAIRQPQSLSGSTTSANNAFTYSNTASFTYVNTNGGIAGSVAIDQAGQFCNRLSPGGCNIPPAAAVIPQVVFGQQQVVLYRTPMWSASQIVIDMVFVPPVATNTVTISFSGLEVTPSVYFTPSTAHPEVIRAFLAFPGFVPTSDFTALIKSGAQSLSVACLANTQLMGLRQIISTV